MDRRCASWQRNRRSSAGRPPHGQRPHQWLCDYRGTSRRDRTERLGTHTRQDRVARNGAPQVRECGSFTEDEEAVVVPLRRRIGKGCGRIFALLVWLATVFTRAEE